MKKLDPVVIANKNIEEFKEEAQTDFVKNLLPRKHSIIHLCLCDEKKINKRKWNPRNLEKNEDYKFIE